MTGTAVVFDDGAAYDALMGRWSRAVGEVFLTWCAPRPGVRWLDVGCGTGVFTELLVARCSPASVAAVDPAQPQIDHARRRAVVRHVDFGVADAQRLPFPDATFDVVASALVLNFVPDPRRAVAEMRRVGRPGGLVAGYVWNFAERQSPTWPLTRAMQRIGVEPPKTPGADITALAELETLFQRTGLTGITTRVIDVSVEFPDFVEYWRTQTPAFNPLGKAIAAMSDAQRQTLVNAVREEISPRDGGPISFTARAHAVKALVPGS